MRPIAADAGRWSTSVTSTSPACMRPAVLEALLAVDHHREVEAELGVGRARPPPRRDARSGRSAARSRRGGRPPWRPPGRGRSGSWSPIASANSLIFTRLTSYGSGGGNARPMKSRFKAMQSIPSRPSAQCRCGDGNRTWFSPPRQVAGAGRERSGMPDYKRRELSGSRGAPGACGSWGSTSSAPAVRVVAPVLPRDVVAVLALLAGQRDLWPYVGGSHCGSAFLREGQLDGHPSPDRLVSRRLGEGSSGGRT